MTNSDFIEGASAFSERFTPEGRYVDRFQAAKISGPMVVVDILRAFTTAAYAFAAGAERIVLVDSVEEALTLKNDRPGWLAMGENHGKRVDGFDLTNSPVQVSQADLSGKPIVMRTTAGTRGVVACANADRVWAGALVTASATAAAVRNSGLGDPHYVVTGSWPGRSLAGNDDWWTSLLIDRVREGKPALKTETEEAIRSSTEADFTLGLGEGNADPEDVEYALKTDLFSFALEAKLQPDGHWELFPTPPGVRG